MKTDINKIIQEVNARCDELMGTKDENKSLTKQDVEDAVKNAAAAISQKARQEEIENDPALRMERAAQQLYGKTTDREEIELFNEDMRSLDFDSKIKALYSPDTKYVSDQFYKK